MFATPVAKKLLC